MNEELPPTWNPDEFRYTKEFENLNYDQKVLSALLQKAIAVEAMNLALMEMLFDHLKKEHNTDSGTILHTYAEGVRSHAHERAAKFLTDHLE